MKATEKSKGRWKRAVSAIAAALGYALLVAGAVIGSSGALLIRVSGRKAPAGLASGKLFLDVSGLLPASKPPAVTVTPVGTTPEAPKEPAASEKPAEAPPANEDAAPSNSEADAKRLLGGLKSLGYDGKAAKRAVESLRPRLGREPIETLLKEAIAALND